MKKSLACITINQLPHVNKPLSKLTIILINIGNNNHFVSVTKNPSGSIPPPLLKWKLNSYPNSEYQESGTGNSIIHD